MLQAAGRHKTQIGGEALEHAALEHAQHDRADKGEGDTRGNYAQSADESHGKTPWFTSLLALTKNSSKSFPAEKVSAAVYLWLPSRSEPLATWLKSREIKALKSP
jgi:hypothetical protein